MTCLHCGLLTTIRRYGAAGLTDRHDAIGALTLALGQMLAEEFPHPRDRAGQIDRVAAALNNSARDFACEGATLGLNMLVRQ